MQSRIYRRKRNKYLIVEMYTILYVRATTGEILEAYIDTLDLDKVLDEGHWYAIPSRNTWYVVHCRFGKMVRLHRFIMGKTPLDGSIVDHRDRDGLNNRRYNLRDATHSINSRNRVLNANNTSGHQGVVFDKESGKWRAQGQLNGKNMHLGRFEKKEDAIRAREEWVLEMEK